MRALFALSVGLLLLSSCGRVFCVGPIGPIDECYAEPQSTGNTSGTTTGYYIAVSPVAYQGATSPAGTTPTTLTLTATNGSGTGTYSWVMTVVEAATTAPTFTNSAGSATSPITGTSVLFTPAANTSGTYKVTVTDSGNSTNTSYFLTFAP